MQPLAVIVAGTARSHADYPALRAVLERSGRDVVGVELVNRGLAPLEESAEQVRASVQSSLHGTGRQVELYAHSQGGRAAAIAGARLMGDHVDLRGLTSFAVPHGGMNSESFLARQGLRAFDGLRAATGELRQERGWGRAARLADMGNRLVSPGTGTGGGGGGGGGGLSIHLLRSINRTPEMIGSLDPRAAVHGTVRGALDALHDYGADTGRFAHFNAVAHSSDRPTPHDEMISVESALLPSDDVVHSRVYDGQTHRSIVHDPVVVDEVVREAQAWFDARP